MAEPVIIDTNAQTILDELKADFLSRTGRTLQDGQAETMLLSSWAYREAIIRSQIQNAACQNLVDFAIAPILDYHGRLVGVNRLPAAPATTTLVFTLVTGHTGGTILAGTRVASVDNKVEFTTIETASFVQGDLNIAIQGVCNVDGTAGNGYVSGSVNVLLSPITAVSSVANSTTTAGGSEAESDEQLRSRIILAPASYSTAGSKASYKFWAKTAHPSITDVVVLSDTPGVVKIYPKVTGGVETSQQVLDLVQAICSGDTVRPLCDSVIADTPTLLDYVLDIEIVTYTSADQDLTLANVIASLNALNLLKSESLGQDVLTDHIIAACMVEGVYSVDIGTFTNIIAGETEFAYCTSITVAISDTTNG